MRRFMTRVPNLFRLVTLPCCHKTLVNSLIQNTQVLIYVFILQLNIYLTSVKYILRCLMHLFLFNKRITGQNVLVRLYIEGSTDL